MKFKFPLYNIHIKCYDCKMFVEGMKGIVGEREPKTDLQFSVESFVPQGGQQLDSRSQRNQDLGRLTSLKIGI